MQDIISIWYMAAWKLCVVVDSKVKAGLLWQKQPTNILKIRILSETSIFDLIRHASVILSAGLYVYRRVSTSEHCWKKKIVVHSGLELATFGLQV